MVITCEACPAERRQALAAVAEVVVVGDDDVDLAALGALRRAGPRLSSARAARALNGQLIAAGLVGRVVPHALAPAGLGLLGPTGGRPGPDTGPHVGAPGPPARGRRPPPARYVRA